MFQRKRISVTQIGLVWTLGIASLCPGQVGTASIRGSVSDPSGGVVPGARVVVKNVQTGITSNLTTDTDGRYVAPTLPIGTYEISVQAQ